MSNYIRLWHTVKYLKFKQIYFRIYYLLRSKLRKIFYLKSKIWIDKKGTSLYFIEGIFPVSRFYSKKNKFKFLNHSIDFQSKIDWNYNKYGKLWTYNLNYFDYLNQEDMDKEEGLFLINEYISNIEDNIYDGLDPFPISLRGINWIKFLTKHYIYESYIDESLYAQYMILLDKLEYHLLGNHLLENAFSLLFGGYYFNDNILLTKANKILSEELDEQILDDGSHYELSPMYHQIMLYRILDCINLMQNNTIYDQRLFNLLTKKASIMLSWLEYMTFNNGDIPLLNDSAKVVAPDSKQLFNYASKLNIIKKDQLPLKESGYRSITKSTYECIVDVGNIGPDYIPGHAHADTFHFILYYNNEPFIVDTGTSTYESNDRREIERSTYAHNTVVVNKTNQSNVWGAFRVAKRAKIIQLNETEQKIQAVHDGYRDLGIFHERTFLFYDDELIIQDRLNKPSEKSTAYIHFHPNVTLKIKDSVVFTDHVSIYFENMKNIEIKEYLYSDEFNLLQKAFYIEISFNTSLSTKISLKKKSSLDENN